MQIRYCGYLLFFLFFSGSLFVTHANTKSPDFYQRHLRNSRVKNASDSAKALQAKGRLGARISGKNSPKKRPPPAIATKISDRDISVILKMQPASDSLAMAIRLQNNLSEPNLLLNEFIARCYWATGQQDIARLKSAEVLRSFESQKLRRELFYDAIKNNDLKMAEHHIHGAGLPQNEKWLRIIQIKFSGILVPLFFLLLLLSSAFFLRRKIKHGKTAKTMSSADEQNQAESENNSADTTLVSTTKSVTDIPGSDDLPPNPEIVSKATITQGNVYEKNNESSEPVNSDVSEDVILPPEHHTEENSTELQNQISDHVGFEDDPAAESVPQIVPEPTFHHPAESPAEILESCRISQDKLPEKVSTQRGLFYSPNSGFTEQEILSLFFVGLQLKISETGIRVIAVTSEDEAANRALVTLQIAECFASDDYKTLLIDADYTAPDLYSLLEMPQTPGLANLLETESHFSSLFRATSISQLNFLACGTPPESVMNMREQAWDLLLNYARKNYEVIIISFPPESFLKGYSFLVKQAGIIELARKADKNHSEDSNVSWFVEQRPDLEIFGVLTPTNH